MNKEELKKKTNPGFLNKLKIADEEANELVAMFSAAIRTIKSKNPKSLILNN